MERFEIYRWSEKSLERLRECHPDLQVVANAVLEVIDTTIICGHRGREAQEQAYQEGYTKVRYPGSLHNLWPSHAIDMAPYPIDWENTERFIYFAGVVKAMAHKYHVSLRWGGDWDRDNDVRDERFLDLVHFELWQPE